LGPTVHSADPVNFRPIPVGQYPKPGSRALFSTLMPGRTTPPPPAPPSPAFLKICRARAVRKAPAPTPPTASKAQCKARLRKGPGQVIKKTKHKPAPGAFYARPPGGQQDQPATRALPKNGVLLRVIAPGSVPSGAYEQRLKAAGTSAQNARRQDGPALGRAEVSAQDPASRGDKTGAHADEVPDPKGQDHEQKNQQRVQLCSATTYTPGPSSG